MSNPRQFRVILENTPRSHLRIGRAAPCCAAITTVLLERRRAEISGPIVHQPQPPLEQVRARIRRLHLVRDHLRQRRLDDLPRVVSLPGSPVAERRAEPMRHGRNPVVWSNLGSVAIDIGFPLRMGKASGLPSPGVRAVWRISIARLQYHNVLDVNEPKVETEFIDTHGHDTYGVSRNSRSLSSAPRSEGQERRSLTRREERAHS